MNLYKQILSVFFAFLSLITISNADVVDVTNKFNDLILNNDPLEYPYLEDRNDIGVFYEFSYDKKLNLIKIRRNQKNYPIIRFSLFNKKDIKPGDIVRKIQRNRFI
jgi:hypothetical protein